MPSHPSLMMTFFFSLQHLFFVVVFVIFVLIPSSPLLQRQLQLHNTVTAFTTTNIYPGHPLPQIQLTKAATRNNYRLLRQPTITERDHISFLTATTVFASTIISSTSDDKKQEGNKKLEKETQETKTKTIRPLHQNWWPVSIETSLHPDRPNAIELLGQKLVLYREESGDGRQWKCLADRCSHRFAPLSEGRIVTTPSRKNNDGRSLGKECSSSSSCPSSIQCAYHGWEFNSSGKCVTVPQYPAANANNAAAAKGIDERKVKSVPTYPVRNEAGMIWIWSDPHPSSWDRARSIPLPISPLVRRSYETFGADACFMRDLPYGAELLGENLLDLSHLPFSHHSVGGLDREMGVELPLRVMSERERVDYAAWEEEFTTTPNGNDNDNSGNGYAIPLHQVEIQNATQTDPMFLTIAKRFPSAVSNDANATISFFEPCHVRYRRERLPGTYGHVELFMSPTRAGKSRVFLWNTVHTPPPPPVVVVTERRRLRDRLAKLSPLAAVKKILLAKLMNPATTRSHAMAHAIFDGDGIFLHKQGHRMDVENLSYRDYSTPSTADVLLNSYRRYLDAASRQSLEQEESSSIIGSAAADAVSYQKSDAYGDDIPRSELLDRYNSHTKNCPLCSAALETCERRRGVYGTIKTGLVGASGASTVGLLMAALVSTTMMTAEVVPLVMVRAAAVSAAASILGSIGISRKLRKLEERIQSFRFEDYVHAEKN